MAIDPNIPLMGRMPAPIDPLAIYGQVAQVAALRDQAEARRQAAEEARTKAARQQQIDDAYTKAVRVDPETGKVTIDRSVLLPHLPGADILEVNRQLDEDEASVLDYQTKKLALAEAGQKHLRSAARTIKASGYDPLMYGVQLKGAHALRAIDDETYAQLRDLRDPAQIQRVVDGLLAQPADQERGVVVGQRVVHPVTGEVIYEGSPAAEQFTLGAGQVRYNEQGEVIAQGPAAREPRVPPEWTWVQDPADPTKQRLVPAAQAAATGARRPPVTAESGRGVTSADAGRIADFDTSRDDLAVLAGAITPAGATGTAAKAGASLPNWVTDLTGWGVDAKKKQAMIDRVKQVIGKALEGGVLRKEDEYKYERILPTIGDTPVIVRSKLAELDTAIAARRQTQLDALTDAGYDTSRFAARAVRPPLRPSAPSGAGALSVTAPNGTTYTFKTAAEAAAFKRRAGIP